MWLEADPCITTKWQKSSVLKSLTSVIVVWIRNWFHSVESENTAAYTYSVSHSPEFLTFSPKWLGMLVQILHAYCTFLSTLDYIFNYLQLWRSYAILSATTVTITPCLKKTVQTYFLSELCQISMDCKNFWQKDSRENRLFWGILIFHLT